MNESINYQVFLERLIHPPLKILSVYWLWNVEPAFVAVKHNIIETINACECTIFGDKVATLTNDVNIMLRCKL